jgi:E3 ubiquitin-protein ligase TRIP12
MLYSFPSERIVPLLIKCLSSTAIPEIPVFAINCISHLLDIFPNIRDLVISAHGVPALCAKLGDFEFIDMAEKSVQVLEKLSTENGRHLIKEGVLTTLLNLLDFFELGVQKSAFGVIINIVKFLRVNEEAETKVLDLIPRFVEYL